jgi:hypothetical protein
MTESKTLWFNRSPEGGGEATKIAGQEVARG